MQYGIFVGSFNPITKAHINICNEVLNKSLVDKIVLVPVKNNEKELLDINIRLDMLNLITTNNILVDNICINNSFFNYQVIDKLKEKYYNITIIIGSDLLINLKKFDNYHYLLDNYNYIVIPRDNIDYSSIINNLYNEYKNKFTILNYQNNISSTLVRNNLKNNLSINNYVDKKVMDYIYQFNLYKK